MDITFDTSSIASYRQFLAVKRLPAYSIRGHYAKVPNEYAARIVSSPITDIGLTDYEPESFLYDYQGAITGIAVRKKKYAVYADCGYGKTLILLSYANYVQHRVKGKILILTPPLVVKQIAAEAERFWADKIKLEFPKAANLQEWLDSPGTAIGITNYEALKDGILPGNLKALICDEASVFKSHYGNWATTCIRLGRGLEWKLALTGTPAPNDRIEYANHAVFLDRFTTINAFLATYFVNRGQTDNRWELKPHALKPFYRSLSDWCIFLNNPATYGWKDNVGTIPPIDVKIHDVELTLQQKKWVNTHLRSIIATKTGGITMRSAYGQVSKGYWKGTNFETNKPDFIKGLVDSWKDKHSTIVWCLYDKEQALNECALSSYMESMDGSTPMNIRQTMIDRFKSRETTVLISKPKILGFGLNLQVATRHVFSGLQDSYESYYQCVKRSNRIGSTETLGVHIPVTELEMPMVDNVIRKAARVDSDTREQEALFLECSIS